MFNGKGIDEKKVHEMETLAEDEDVETGPANLEDLLLMREMKIEESERSNLV